MLKTFGELGKLSHFFADPRAFLANPTPFLANLTANFANLRGCYADPAAFS
jgi:hypothetical protein